MGTKSVCPFARTYIKNWYYSIENQKHLRCVLSTMGITYRRNSVSGATHSYYDMRLPDLLFYCLCRSVVNAHVNILTESSSSESSPIRSCSRYKLSGDWRSGIYTVRKRSPACIGSAEYLVRHFLFRAHSTAQGAMVKTLDVDSSVP